MKKTYESFKIWENGKLVCDEVWKDGKLIDDKSRTKDAVCEDAGKPAFCGTDATEIRGGKMEKTGVESDKDVYVFSPEGDHRVCKASAYFTSVMAEENYKKFLENKAKKLATMSDTKDWKAAFKESKAECSALAEKCKKHKTEVKKLQNRLSERDAEIADLKLKLENLKKYFDKIDV